MYRGILEDSRRLKDEITTFAQELIRIPSPSLAEGALADRVEAAMEELGYHLVTRDDHGNVVGVVLRDEALPTVLLNSHMDTVAPSTGWTRPPRDGQIEGGRLYGLGAADCKGGLAAQIYAGHILARSLLPLRGNLVVAATVAEQNGCSVGLRHLVKHTLRELDLSPTFAILGEPTALGLCYGHDGWVEVDVRVEGGSCARVHQAVELIRREIDGVPADHRGAEWPLVDFHALAPVVGVSVIRLARRLLHGESAQGFVSWAQRRAAVARSLGSTSVEVRLHEEPERLYTGTTTRVRFCSEPWTSNPFDPMVDRARDALVVAGMPPVLRRWQLRQLGMGTAGGYLVRHRIPTVGFGPGDEAQAHACDESLELDSLVRATYATAVMAHAFIGSAALKI